MVFYYWPASRERTPDCRGEKKLHNAEMSHEYPDHTLRFRVQYALALLREREPGSKVEAMAQEERIRDG